MTNYHKASPWWCFTVVPISLRREARPLKKTVDFLAIPPDKEKNRREKSHESCRWMAKRIVDLKGYYLTSVA